MEIEFGNASSIETHGTGWFLGFSDWTRTEPGGTGLRYMPQEALSQALAMKWMFHPAGDPRGGVKPLSAGRTLSIMVSETGRFRLQFSQRDSFPPHGMVEQVLERQGDFVVWGENIYHRWMVDADSTILTLRWAPQSFIKLTTE